MEKICYGGSSLTYQLAGRDTFFLLGGHTNTLAVLTLCKWYSIMLSCSSATIATGQPHSVHGGSHLHVSEAGPRDYSGSKQSIPSRAYNCMCYVSRS